MTRGTTLYVPIVWIKNATIRRTVIILGTPVLLILCVPLCAIGVAKYWWQVMTTLVSSARDVW